MGEPNLKSKAVKGTIWSFAERFSVQIIQFILSLILARILSPSDYGLIGMLAIFIAIANVFIDGGFSTALIQKKQRTGDDLSTVFFINVGIALLCYLIFYLIAPIIAFFYEKPILTPLLRVLSLTFVFGAVGGVNNTLLTINVDFKTKSKISLIAGAVSGIISIICALRGMGVWSLVILQLSSSVFTTLFSFIYVKWYPSWIFSKKSFHEMFSFGSKLLASSIIASAYTNIYEVIIGKFFSSKDLGYFTRARGFVNLVSNNINDILSRVSFPVLSQIQDDDDRLLHIYSKYIKLSSFIIFPLVLGLCGIAKPLILALLTEKWAPSVLLLQILSFSCVWNGIIDINLNLIKVKGRSDIILKLEIIKKIIAFTILAVTAMFSNLYILTLGLVLYSFIALYMNTVYTKKIIHYGFLKQLKDFSPYFCVSVVIMLIALTVANIMNSSLLALITSLIICPIVYLLICKYFKLQAYTEFSQLLQPILTKFRER